MLIKGSRGRGRPPGKYHSLADFRILEYLALISMKYGISPDDFFDGFVEAWKHQESTCESLLIECRKRTRDYAVFLITNSCKVVAQFSIPERILEETNPLKEFARARESEGAIAKRAKVKHLRIGDLKSGMKQINLKARVLKIQSRYPSSLGSEYSPR